jgi:hypothetical protein
MARTKTEEPKAPAFIAWTVTTKGENVFWNRMGAAWHHKDGKGLSLKLDTLPVDGRIVLRAPLEAEAGARS